MLFDAAAISMLLTPYADFAFYAITRDANAMFISLLLLMITNVLSLRFSTYECRHMRAASYYMNGYHRSIDEIANNIVTRALRCAFIYAVVAPMHADAISAHFVSGECCYLSLSARALLRVLI